MPGLMNGTKSFKEVTDAKVQGLKTNQLFCSQSFKSKLITEYGSPWICEMEVL